MHIHLKDVDPNFKKGNKKKGKEELAEIQIELAKQHELLYSEHKHSILVVLQGMDTSGKDGVINRAISGFNAQGVRVIPFKVPTKEEADHDFLWRIHGETPAKGEIVIFNRSHYEDVLFPRVHGLIDDDEVKHRYEHINMFEQLLARQGTTILKFFLHISNAKQKDRLQERIDDPSKNWKISEADFKERVHWNKYMRAYEDAINATNTKYAKWNVIPANSKWFRNLCVARIVLKTMENLKMESPKPIKSLKGVSVE